MSNFEFYLRDIRIRRKNVSNEYLVLCKMLCETFLTIGIILYSNKYITLNTSIRKLLTTGRVTLMTLYFPFGRKLTIFC